MEVLHVAFGGDFEVEARGCTIHYGYTRLDADIVVETSVTIRCGVPSTDGVIEIKTLCRAIILPYRHPCARLYCNFWCCLSFRAEVRNDIVGVAGEESAVGFFVVDV